MKPIYKILIVAGIIIVVGWLIYLAWSKFSATPTLPAPQANTAPSGSLPLGNQNNVSSNQSQTNNSPLNGSSTNLVMNKLSDGPVFGFWVMPDTGSVDYLTPDGQVMTAEEATDQTVSNQTINALNSISVSPDNREVLAAFGDPASPQWGIFDVLDKVWRPLPSEIIEAAWGGASNKLIAFVQNGGNTNLAWVDLTKTPPTYRVLIKDLRLENANLTVLPNQKIIISEKPDAAYPGRVWQLDPKTLALNLLESPLNGLTIGWSTDKSVAFQFNDPDNFLIFNGDLSQIISDTFGSLPSKCNTASSTIYCFVPQNLPANLNLPDDYFQKSFYSTDNLYSLSLGTSTLGNVSRLFVSGENNVMPIDAKDPQIMNNAIYFVNRYDNYLYELQLPNQ